MSDKNTIPLKLATYAGLLLLICGIGALLLALVELWMLYREPSGILPLVQAIDSMGGLDGTLLGLTAEQGQRPMPVAQFLAWLLAVVLLATIGRIAYLAIRAGASLISLAEPEKPQRQEPVITRQEEELPKDYRPSHRQQKPEMPSIRPPARSKRG